MGLLKTTHNHYNTSKTEYIPFCKEVNVKEIKAPTDESVRLLNEMQEKATENIIKIIEIKENWIEAISIFYSNDVVIDKCTFHSRFIINGKEYYVKKEIDRSEMNTESHRFYGHPESAFKFLLKVYSEAVAENILNQLPTLHI